jgi:hypothetical protein
VAGLIELWHPYTLVVEDCQVKGSRRCERVKRLLGSITRLSVKRRVKTRVVSVSSTKKVFSTFQARTKHQIAQAIAKQLPELAAWLPKYRKPWMSEDYRMAIFDATAFALAYLYSQSARAQTKKH